MHSDIKNAINEAEKILIGLGEEFDKDREKAVAAYKEILSAVDGKDYFIVSLSEDDVICGIGFDEKKITRPLIDTDENWDAYNAWITRTLNKELRIIELNVGLKYPNVIRWPFEKITFVNNKAKLIRVHKSLYQGTEEIKGKCVSVKGDALDVIIEE